MARDRHRSRSAEDFANAPDHDRDWTRPGPDYESTGKEGGSRQLPESSGRGNIDRADYGDYGIDDVRSFGGVPRDLPPATYPPNWGQRDAGRDTWRGGSHLSGSNERGLPEAFGFAAPNNYPYAGIASTTRRGRFFGRGPKGYRRSDERIREEISDRLMTHPDIDASDLEINVANGVVTLTGTVEDRHEKRLAEYIAEDALGVNDVENRLKVRHGFWAAITGERAMERELPTHTGRDASEADRATEREATHEAGRANSARNAARRDSEAR